MSDAVDPSAGSASRAEAAGATDRSETGWQARLFARREIGVLLGFVLLLGIMLVSRHDLFLQFEAPFLRWGELSNVLSRVLRQIAPYTIIGIGMTYLIVGGEFDLSVGSVYAVGGISFSILLNDFRLIVPAALAVVLLIGAGVGLANGVIVTKVGVPSLIATIGMLSVLRGIAYYLTGGGSVQTPDLPLIDVFGGGFTLFGVEIAHQVVWSIVLLIVFGLFLQLSRFGFHVYATGDDEEAAQMTGIDTDRVKVINFMLTSILAAFAGVVAISYFGSMFGTAGQGFELAIIAAVVIGGTNLFGGEGTLTGTFVGSLVIGIIPIVLILNGLAVELQEFITGVVIILAVVVDILFRR